MRLFSSSVCAFTYTGQVGLVLYPGLPNFQGRYKKLFFGEINERIREPDFSGEKELGQSLSTARTHWQHPSLRA
jgi:hypothetical protein